MVFFKAPDADAMTAAFKNIPPSRSERRNAPRYWKKAATLQVAHSGGCGGQDKAEGAGTMKQVNVKKLILPNIPYVFIALLATKVSGRCGWLPVRTLPRSC